MKLMNEGITDRIARLCAGACLVLGAFAFNVTEGSIAGIVVAVLAGVLLLTGLVGFCPAYALVGFRSCDVKTDAG